MKDERKCGFGLTSVDVYQAVLWYTVQTVTPKGVGEMGETAQGLDCLTPVLVCTRMAFSHYTVAVVCLLHVLLSKIDNNGEGNENFFHKSLCRVNDSFKCLP
jgi:hypothetical protein